MALPRNVQAFQALLAPDDDDDDRRGRGGRGGGKPKGKPRPKAASARPPTQGFRLRDEAPAATRPAGAGLAQVQELFAGALPPDVIDEVYRSFSPEAPEAAIEALLAMAAPGGAIPSAGAQAPPPPSADPAAATTSASAAAAAAAAAAVEAPRYWDSLPEECKQLVLGQLPLRELSRAARACRELALHARVQRAALAAVAPPPGLSAAALRGLVAACSGAAAVDLSRWRGALRDGEDLRAACAAVGRGAADRGASGAAVEALSLAGCAAAVDDRGVAALCAALNTLRSLDLSRCHRVGDGALAALARYRRRPPPSAAAAASPWDGEEEAQAVGGLGALTLEPSGRASGAGGGGSAFSLESPAQSVGRVAAAAGAARRAAAGAESGGGGGGGLEVLRLGGTGVTSAGVAALLLGAGRAPALRLLDVSRCEGVKALALGPAAPLRELRAAACPGLRALELRLPGGATLAALSLPDCAQLATVRVAAPALEDLNLSGCGALRVLSLRCPRLRRLRAAGCRALTLGGGGGGGEVGLECPSLQELSLFGCRGVDADALHALLPSLPDLRTLDLSGCRALRRLAPPAPALRALRALTADGCVALRRLEAAAPALEELSARGCGRLEVSARAAARRGGCDGGMNETRLLFLITSHFFMIVFFL
jgi:hypothetical protein